MALPPRASWTPWSAYRGLVGSRRVFATLLVAVGIPLGLFAGDRGRWGQGDADEDAAVEADTPPRETPNVLVAMHLDEPLPQDRTVVWTAAFQAAWDAMADAAKKEWGLPTFDLGPSAPAADVKALNAGRLAPGVVNPKDLTVIAGPATEETWSRIEGASDRDPGEGAPPPRGIDLVAFARLKASARYEVPFDVRTEPLLFGPRGVPVRAYGFTEGATGEKAETLRRQAVLAADYVVVLEGTDGTRVVLSGRPPKATLRETWRDIANAMARSPLELFGAADELWIPRVSIVARRSFDALVGAPIAGMPPDAKITVAREDVTLTADERGADVDAEAVIHAWASDPRVVVYDGPFLLALLAPGSEVPYALAWIGSADGLSRWGEPVGRPLTADEAKKFVGTWSLDRSATVEETVRRWRPALREGPPAETWEERVARAQGMLTSHFTGRVFEVVVASDGAAGVTDGPVASPKSHAPSPLERDGARVVLQIRSPDGEKRYGLTRNGDRLTLRPLANGPTLVLLRR